MSVSHAFCAPVTVAQCPTVNLLLDTLKLGPRDLIVTEERVYQNYLSKEAAACRILIRDRYGKGPNTDKTLLQAVDDAGTAYDRVIGMGGGAVLDLAKLLVLERPLPVKNLFENPDLLRKSRELILVPTTPGTGSEVTPYVALYIEDLGQQLILMHDLLYADSALLCPALLENMPFSPFAASMLDAFTHALESYLSPLSTPLSRTVSLEAMRVLIRAFMGIARDGISALHGALTDIQMAGTMGGIGYANAGCAAIHALSYPLSVRLRIPHGEANYLVCREVLRLYEKKAPDGPLKEVKRVLASAMQGSEEHAFDELDGYCQALLPRRRLSSYGMTEEQILSFTDMVLTRQNLLIANGYVTLTPAEIASVYRALL